MSPTQSEDEVDDGDGSQTIQINIDSADEGAEKRTFEVDCGVGAGSSLADSRVLKTKVPEELRHENGGSYVDNSNVHPDPEIDNFGFNYLFLRRFYHLHGLLFLSFGSLSSVVFAFLLSLSLLDEYIGYQVGLIPSRFYSVLGSKDLNGFWMQTLVSAGIILAVSFSKSTKLYLSKVLTATWRQLLSKATHRRYFADIHYYQLNVLDKTIDNPDQRMTQDIDKFCTTYGEILPQIIISPFVIAYYSHQSYTRSGWHGPVGCFVFFIIATVLNKVLMSPIVQMVVKQEKYEGDFRFLHLLVRVNSESIAFHNASNLEMQKTNESLDSLVKVQHSLYCKQYILNFAVNFFNYAGSILSYLVLAVPIFAGSYNNLSPAELSALISENAFVNIYLISCFTSLVQISGKISDVAGVSHRISQLIERINALSEFWNDLFPLDNNENNAATTEKYAEWLNLRKSKDNGKPGSLVNFKLPNLPAWTLNNISFSPPHRQEPLVHGLTLSIYVGVSILIIGNSSAGKSSLLRLLRGLWPHSEGTITRHLPPGPRGAFYCPQKPYLTVGTLREQICFPLRYACRNTSEDDTIINYLHIMKMMPLLERIGGLDTPVAWNIYDSLSPGEMQRLCFLRLFYHRPMVAVLDEATSALPIEMEDLVYSECQRLGITMVSVGHRMSLRKYHEKLLYLDSQGGWTLESIHED